jgi:hypothetical protein
MTTYAVLEAGPHCCCACWASSLAFLSLCHRLLFHASTTFTSTVGIDGFCNSRHIASPLPPPFVRFTIASRCRAERLFSASHYTGSATYAWWRTEAARSCAPDAPVLSSIAALSPPERLCCVQGRVVQRAEDGAHDIKAGNSLLEKAGKLLITYVAMDRILRSNSYPWGRYPARWSSRPAEKKRRSQKIGYSRRTYIFP